MIYFSFSLEILNVIKLISVSLSLVKFFLNRLQQWVKYRVNRVPVQFAVYNDRKGPTI